MKSHIAVIPVLALLAPYASSKLLWSWTPNDGDLDPKAVHIEYESSPGNSLSGPIDQTIYIKSSIDTQGQKALHFHRNAGYRRAEVAPLRYATYEGEKYYIGYLMYQPVGSQTQRIPIWEIPTPMLNDKHHAAFIIDTTRNNNDQGTNAGSVQFFWDGKQQTLRNLDGKYVTTFPGQFFLGHDEPGSAAPKFGSYEPDDQVVDTYVYSFQIGDSWDDIHALANLPASQDSISIQKPSLPATPYCNWMCHCPGDKCDAKAGCQGDKVKCINGYCGGTPLVWYGDSSSDPTSPASVSPSPTTLTTRITTTSDAHTTSSIVSCEWSGHCLGDKCKDDHDCDGDFVCRGGRCAVNSRWS